MTGAAIVPIGANEGVRRVTLSGRKTVLPGFRARSGEVWARLDRTFLLPFVRNSRTLQAFVCQEFVMSIFLSALGIWLAVNLAIVAALHFKPLRNRRRRLVGYGSLAYVKARRRTA